jgi:hypothetical protein
MNQVNVSQTSFVELGLPETIYKYRTWTNPLHHRIITHQEIYMASPGDFDDPNDCKIPVRYDLLSKKDLFDIYLYYSKQDHKNWDRTKHRSFAREWVKKTLLRDPSYIEQMRKEYFEDFFSHFGVLSLTANPHNDQMWKSYSDDHQGFCIGFNTIQLFEYLGGGGIVNYYDDLPIIHPVPKHSFEQQHILQVFSKLRKWEYEEEYRTHKFYPVHATTQQRIIKIPPSAFREIILGKNMPHAIKELLLISIPEDLGHIILIDE